MGIVGLLISRGVRFMSDGLNGPTNEEARELLEIRLEEAQARHAEDLAKLAREMSEVVAQRDEARADYHAAVDRALDAHRVLGAMHNEGTLDAARRVVAERDAARAIRDEAIARAEKAEADRDHERTVHSELVRVWDCERAAILAERDALAAELAAIRAATGEDPTDEVLFAVDQKAWYAATGHIAGRIGGRRALYNLGRAAAQGEVARMREEVSTLRARVAELEAIAREAESQANDMVSQKIAALGVAVNGAADEEAVSPDVQVVRGDFVMTKFRERLARIEAASPPAPQGQPVATDETARVRAERPACLVARAVALGCDVRVCEDVAGWLVAIHESSDLDEDVHRDVAASDVPATLSRLLDEVEAARKAVQR